MIHWPKANSVALKLDDNVSYTSVFARTSQRLIAFRVNLGVHCMMQSYPQPIILL